MAAAVMLAVFISGGGLERLNLGRTLALFYNGPANGAYVVGANSDVYTTPGSYSWTAPPGVYSVVAHIIGGGGGGGTGQGVWQGQYNPGCDCYTGYPGHAGQWVAPTVAVTPGQAYTIVVGAGGAGYGPITLAGCPADWGQYGFGGATGQNSSFGNSYAYGGYGQGGGYMTNGGQPGETNGSGYGSGGWSTSCAYRAGDGQSGYVSVNYTVPPNPPATLDNSCSSNDTISLYWDASSGATGYYPRINSPAYNSGNACPAGWTYSAPTTCYKDNVTGTSITAVGVMGATYSASWVHAGNSGGTSGARYAPAGFTCPPFQFSLAVPDKSVTQESVATLPFGATRVTGRTTTISSFTLTGLPAGVTASFSPSTCSPTVATCSTITFTAASTAVPGAYTVTAYATGGGITRSDPFVLTIAAAGAFTFTLGNGGPTSIIQGSSAPTTITAMRTNGLTTDIGSFTTSGLPSDWTASFSPSSCTPGTTSALCTTFTVAVPSTESPGTYPIIVYASGGGATQATQVDVTVVGDTSSAPVVSFITTDSVAGEDGAANEGTGTFVLTRTADPTRALVVPYLISSGGGNATYGTDYTLSGTCTAIGVTSATIPAGQNTCTIDVTPISDGVGESNPELITFTLQ